MGMAAGGIMAMVPKLSLLFLFLTLVQLFEARHIDEQPTLAFWQKHLPDGVMPVALQNLVSPLSSSSTRVYLARLNQGTLNSSTDQFCTSAGIYCSSKAFAGPGPLVCVLGSFKYEYGYKRCKTSDNNLFRSKASQVFFTSDKLEKGVSLSYPDLTNDLTGQHFLPKDLADALPFNMQGIPVLQNLFETPKSLDSQEMMKDTLQQCAAPAAQGEVKECVASMESMVNFATRNLGSKVDVHTPPSWKASGKGKVTVKEVSAVSGKGKNVISCHDLRFAYLLYSCHMSTTSRVVEVTLGEESGKDLKALAICHSNTKAWNPDHVAFAVLNLNPGDGKEVCHWIPQNHFIWTASTE